MISNSLFYLFEATFRSFCFNLVYCQISLSSYTDKLNITLCVILIMLIKTSSLLFQTKIFSYKYFLHIIFSWAQIAPFSQYIPLFPGLFPYLPIMYLFSSPALQLFFSVYLTPSVANEPSWNEPGSGLGSARPSRATILGQRAEHEPSRADIPWLGPKPSRAEPMFGLGSGLGELGSLGSVKCNEFSACSMCYKSLLFSVTMMNVGRVLGSRETSGLVETFDSEINTTEMLYKSLLRWSDTS